MILRAIISPFCRRLAEIDAQVASIRGHADGQSCILLVVASELNTVRIDPKPSIYPSWITHDPRRSGHSHLASIINPLHSTHFDKFSPPLPGFRGKFYSQIIQTTQNRPRNLKRWGKRVIAPGNEGFTRGDRVAGAARGSADSSAGASNRRCIGAGTTAAVIGYLSVCILPFHSSRGMKLYTS